MKSILLAAVAAATSALMALPAVAQAEAPARPPAALPALPEIPKEAPPPPLPEIPSPPREVKAPAAPPPAQIELPSRPALVQPAWPGWLATAQGALGGLTLPTLAMPAPGRASISAAFDYHRGGNFLFPASTSQRTGWALAGSYGALPWLEAYGSLWFHSTNLFEPSARRTLGSYGDLDAGLKAALPRLGPISGGALLELDLPSGVGGFSLKGAGVRAALLAGWTGIFGNVPLSATALAGYRIDNSGNLSPRGLTTFATYALALSRYDRVEGGLALAVPLRSVTPGVELELSAPIARQTPLPPGGATLLSRLTLGAQVLTPLEGLAWQGGVRISLSRGGRLSDLMLPLDGFAPDAPWQIFTSVAWSFEPHVPQLPRWSREKQPAFASLPKEPAAPSASVAPAKARVLITATDARTRLPVGGAWVAWAEGGEPGAVTSLDGKARLEHDAGAVTIAVAHEKYELFTEPLLLAAGEEKQLALSLTPSAADATVRGRLLGEDAVPLRASVQLAGAGGIKLPEARWFEGSYSIAIPHGQYTVTVATPGFRAEPLRVDVRPGETVTQDVLLRRIAGEATVKLTARVVELSRPVPFVPARTELFPVAFPVLTELASALARDGRAFAVEVRVEQDDLPQGSDAEAQAQVLSAERARGVADYLIAKGVKSALLISRGGGLAKAGQLLLEVTLVDEKAPRTQAAPAGIIERFAALGGHP